MKKKLAQEGGQKSWPEKELTSGGGQRKWPELDLVLYHDSRKR